MIYLALHNFCSRSGAESVARVKANIHKICQHSADKICEEYVFILCRTGPKPTGCRQRSAQRWKVEWWWEKERWMGERDEMKNIESISSKSIRQSSKCWFYQQGARAVWKRIQLSDGKATTTKNHRRKRKKSTEHNLLREISCFMLAVSV